MVHRFLAAGALASIIAAPGAAAPAPTELEPSSKWDIDYGLERCSLMREFVVEGSELLTTITNDAWYGTSSAAFQHWDQAAMRAIENGRYLARAPVVQPCTAERSGFVTGMDAREIGVAVVGLGGGRARADDAIDPAVGFTEMIDVGTPVRAGSLLCVVHAATEARADEAIARLRQAIRIGQPAPAARPVVIDRIAA